MAARERSRSCDCPGVAETELEKPKRGRPRTGIGQPVHVRLSADQLERLDDWIDQQIESPISRPEAVRRLLERVLPYRG